MNYIIMLWFCVGVIIFMALVFTLTQLRSDFVRMNKKLDKIAENLGISDVLQEANNEELKILMYEGKKIKAIKRYRQLTGEGLKEAKEYVDPMSNK